MEEPTSPRGHLEQLWLDLDQAFIKAAEYLDLTDVDSEDEDAYWEEMDIRMHCSTCTVRSVMEIVHPAYQAIIDYLSENPTAG